MCYFCWRRVFSILSTKLQEKNTHNWVGIRFLFLCFLTCLLTDVSPCEVSQKDHLFYVWSLFLYLETHFIYFTYKFIQWKQWRPIFYSLKQFCFIQNFNYSFVSFHKNFVYTKFFSFSFLVWFLWSFFFPFQICCNEMRWAGNWACKNWRKGTSHAIPWLNSVSAVSILVRPFLFFFMCFSFFSAGDNLLG